ncbi:hypothetical protein [Brevundimonas sp.]|jgi:hypothetical protein|uniref:hypothetical protein n=1 Tax=Brevundimonas sp. TaxID=1871086 RepID=UPI00391A328A|nr:hypothetical protein [Brevundimonas sp.]
MQELLIFAVVAASSVGFFVLLKVLAAKVGGANLESARTAFGALDGFTPSDILIYLGSAIAFDAGTTVVAIWEKGPGARIVDVAEVDTWHCGELLTTALDETTSSLMVQLYGANAESPFFKVGVLRKPDIVVWRLHLSEAFGADKEREFAQRTIGPDLGS